MAEIGEKIVRERKKLARRKGRPKKEEAKSIYKELITNSNFEDFYRTSKFLETKETPRALLSVKINENIEMVLITDSNLLFLNKKTTSDVSLKRVKLKGIIPLKSIKKFKVPAGQTDGSFLIELEDGDLYRSEPLYAKVLNQIKEQLTDLVTGTADYLASEIAEKEVSDEDNDKSKNKDEKKDQEDLKNLNEKKDNIVTVRDKLDKLIGKVDQDEDKNQWEHKIISGPVLSGQDELEEKLDSLGEYGWELVDTQRHSVMSKQHAVCFLKRKV